MKRSSVRKNSISNFMFGARFVYFVGCLLILLLIKSSWTQFYYMHLYLLSKCAWWLVWDFSETCQDSASTVNIMFDWVIISLCTKCIHIVAVYLPIKLFAQWEIRIYLLVLQCLIIFIYCKFVHTWMWQPTYLQWNLTISKVSK